MPQAIYGSWHMSYSHLNARGQATLYRTLPSLNALRTFEAAARHGSFKAAAAELCVSQSAVSHQIKLLEAELGIRLFVRKPQGIELSRQGRAYFRSCATPSSALRRARTCCAVRPRNRG